MIHDTIPEFIPVQVKLHKETPIPEDVSQEYIPVDDKRIQTTIPVELPKAETSTEDTPIVNPQYFLPAADKQRLSLLFWSVSISLVSIIMLILLKNSLDVYQSLTHFGIVVGWFYLICIITLASSVGIVIFRMFQDYIRVDDGSELARIGATLNSDSDRNTVLDYAKSIIKKYEEHQLEAVREGVQAFRSRMQVTIDKCDLLEEIRKGIFMHIDQEAERLISKTAQQTLWGTAISPVAVVDMAIVAWRTIVMVRDIANLYGYRPGLLGSLRLFSRILSTVAFAGFSDLVVDAGSNLLGHTLLSRLSVTFANALAVGMLTVRVGIAACINCRPLPFQKGELNNQANLLFKGIKDMLSVIFRKKIKQKSGYMEG